MTQMKKSQRSFGERIPVKKATQTRRKVVPGMARVSTGTRAGLTKAREIIQS